jgi:hypothetical protein
LALLLALALGAAALGASALAGSDELTAGAEPG